MLDTRVNGAAVQKYLGWLEEARTRPSRLPGLPTGIPTLDRRLGGLQPHWLVVLAGRTGQGKTTLAMQMAFDQARYLRDVGDPRVVWVFSGEMSSRELMAREAARQTGVTVKQQAMADYDEQERGLLDVVADDLSTLHIHIRDEPGLNMDRVRKLVDAVELKPAIVILDHLQLAAKRGQPPYVAVTDAIHQCRELRGEAQCPVVVLSQLKRGSATAAGSRGPVAGRT